MDIRLRFTKHESHRDHDDLFFEVVGLNSMAGGGTGKMTVAKGVFNPFPDIGENYFVSFGGEPAKAQEPPPPPPNAPPLGIGGMTQEPEFRTSKR